MRLVEILQKINTFIYLSCQKMFIGRCRNYLVEHLQMYQKIQFSAVIQQLKKDRYRHCLLDFQHWQN